LNMPGMGNIQSMLSKMGMSGLGGLGGKVNTGAMEAQMGRKLKMAQQKERIRAKAEANALRRQMEQASTAALAQQPQQSSTTEEELLKLFSTGEKIEKTPRGANTQKTNNNNKKKKGKK